MPSLIGVRHLQSTALPGTALGWTNPGLSDRYQAQQWASSFFSLLGRLPIKNVSLFSSDLRRATETAEELVKRYQLDHVVDTRLRELNFGQWDGLTWDQIHSQAPRECEDYLNNWKTVRPPGGETWDELKKRSDSFWEDLNVKESESRLFIVVGHSTALRCLASSLLGWTPEKAQSQRLDYGACFRVNWSPAAECTAWGIGQAPLS